VSSVAEPTGPPATNSRAVLIDPDLDFIRAVATQAGPTCIPGAEGPPEPNSRAVLVDPDLDFIRAVAEQAGPTFKRCFQCGTCSSTCELSPTVNPFPRKEMSWAGWGLADRLKRDADVWLCHQCNDCTTNCPRGGRPGDVLAAVRREQILTYSWPRFLASWAREPRYAPLMMFFPAVLLAATVYFGPDIVTAFGLTLEAGQPVSYPYSPPLPHGLINLLFGFVSLVVITLTTVGMVRFWRGLKAGVPPGVLGKKSLGQSLLTTFANVVLHRDFTKCTKASNRFFAHSLLFYGFAALTVVTIVVITHRFNPLIRGEFIYPFNFWSPWKLLANAGGAGVVIGCFMMLRDRFVEDPGAGRSTWFDWSLLWLIMLVALTGFAVEILHYARLEPHRHAAYFLHLLFILNLFLYLPYSKLAHVAYRFVALVFVEWTGRREEGARHD